MRQERWKSNGQDGDKSMEASTGEVYVSVKRDGSVWVRVGTDRQGSDWVHEKQDSQIYHGSVLSDYDIDVLNFLPHSDLCVLTDLELSIHSTAAWQPSYLIVFQPFSKQQWIVNMEHHNDCHSSTVIRLSNNADVLECFHASRQQPLKRGFNFQNDENLRITCGVFNPPPPTDLTFSSDLDEQNNSTHSSYDSENNTSWLTNNKQQHNNKPVDETNGAKKGEKLLQSSLVLKTFSFEPGDKDAWKCDGGLNASNAFTFKGSYYYVYAKVAQCPSPTRMSTSFSLYVYIILFVSLHLSLFVSLHPSLCINTSFSLYRYIIFLYVYILLFVSLHPSLCIATSFSLYSYILLSQFMHPSLFLLYISICIHTHTLFIV